MAPSTAQAQVQTQAQAQAPSRRRGRYQPNAASANGTSDLAGVNNSQQSFADPSGAAGAQGGDPSDPASQASQYSSQPSQSSPFSIPNGSPDTSWFNPYDPATSAQPPSSLPAASTPYYNGTDIAKQYQNNRNTQQNQGDMFQQYFNGQASQRAGAEQAAGAKANQLYTGLEQQPGYSTEQKNAILGNRPDGGNNYQDLLNTNYDQNYLTPEEKAGMSGNPYDPTKQLHAETLDNVNQTSNNARTGAISGAEDRLNQNRGQVESNMRGAVDPNQLNLSQGYQDNASNVLTATGDKVNTAAYDPALDVSSDYSRQAGMSDQEVADTAAMGGQAAGARSRAAIQDLERQAAADGNSSPLAVAAARRQFEDQNAVASADAATNAQLAARNAQRGAATGVESTRLGANQYRTGQQIGAAENLGNMALGEETQKEQMRMAGAQDISNRNLGIARDLGTIGQDNAKTLLNAQTDSANQYQAGGLDAGKYNQSMAYGANATAEGNAATRAGQIATNRQGTSQTNQGNQFNRGYQVNANNSNMQQGIADKDLAGKAETRNYYTGQQQYQGAQGNQAQSNLLTNRQQTQTGVNQATQGSAQWENMNKQNPSLGGQLVKGVMNAAIGGASKAAMA